MYEKLQKFYILGFAAFLSFSNVCQAETKVGIESFKINPNENIELTSQSMTFNDSIGKASFFKDVTLKYGELRLLAQELTFVHPTKDKDLNHLTFFASGPITITTENILINGDTADFIGKKQELTIMGNVSLKDDNNTIMGNKLVLDLQNGVASITGSVKTIINPTGQN